jgi:hypothetical protein
MTDAPRFPAGWYADPENPTVHRWWDGQRWTEARQPAYGMTPPPQAPAQAQAPAQPQMPPQPQVPAQSQVPERPAVPAQPQVPERPAAPAQQQVPPPFVPPQHTPPQQAAPQHASPTAPPQAAPAAPQTAPAYPAPATIGFADAPQAAGSAPGYPQAPTYPSAPAYPGAAETEVRRDIRTNTVWIWLVVLLPLLTFPTLLMLDWGSYLEDVVRESVDPSNGVQTWTFNWSLGSVAITLLSYVVVAAQIVFAWLDWRTLRRRGVERPFHWAWIFFTLVITNGVYIIGRGVVLRRRTGSGLAPIWAWIAVTVLGWILTAVFIAALINEIFAVLAREGLLTS